MTDYTPIPSSFRDPSGFIYKLEGELYRQVNKSYASDFNHLRDSGLYQKLVDHKLLVTHEEVDPTKAVTDAAEFVIKPTLIPILSFPYEWTFHQLKAAALLTLKIQQVAFEHEMVLKDASAYNVQFLGAQPIFIDTLSFEKYKSGTPWVAYKQFCEHFLAPLLLTRYVHPQAISFMQNNIDGIPLDLAAAMLPMRAKFRPSIYTHVVLHAKTQARYAGSVDSTKGREAKVSMMGFKGLIDNLESLVKSLTWHHPDTEWGGYYQDTNYIDSAMDHKKALVDEFLGFNGRANTIVDAGANTGVFSEIARKHAEHVVSLDIDPVAVDRHFLQRQEDNDTSVLPLHIDLTTPSPGIGWQNTERPPILERVVCDVVLALALIHHLAISNNVPLRRIAEMFSALAPNLIIEFVPKSDSQVQRLLATREDIFPDYNTEGFESAFSEFYQVAKREPVNETERTLYLLKRRD